MEEEFQVFDADSAINFHSGSEHFTKYRAVEVFASEAHSFSLLQSTPAHKTDLFIDDRKLFTSVPNSHASSKKNLLLAVTPSPNSVAVPSSSITVQCPEKPTRVSPNLSFYTKEIDFHRIQVVVDKVLKELSDYDSCFIPSEATWKCKFFRGSNQREIDVSCYWDSFCEDHLVEVKRVKGDGSVAQSRVKNCAEIFESLQAAVLSGGEGLVENKPKKGGRLRGGALPLPLSMASTKVVQNKELFLQGVEPIVKMADSPNMETRVEAARMLCDLAENADKSLLFLPECQDLCYQSIELLLHEHEETDDDLRQFTMMAFGMLCEFDCYQECFLHLKDFDSIIRCVDNAVSSKPSCLCVQMRRQAARGLMALVKKASASPATFPSAKLFLAKQLQCSGFFDEQCWKLHCEQLEDEKLRKLALDISACYH
mmetsp:Transcript_18654/g.20283  ORF Transcript_18654/g.20283 Transcript_18654/m.20283 type:complete len:426 (-) Transcript_18654:200-1477(-)